MTRKTQFFIALATAAAFATIASAQGQPSYTSSPANKIECYKGDRLVYASTDRSIAKFDAAKRGLTLQRQWNYPGRSVVFYFYSDDAFCLVDPS